jgi:predicted phosphohydrolase
MMAEYVSFADWLNQQPFKHKIFVPGNHDWSCNSNQYYLIKSLFNSSVHVLIADLIEIEGLTIFGSAREGYERCPSNVDILITHEPPSNILDEIPAFSRFNPDPHPFYLGSTALLNEIVERIKPKHHIFGHVHECGGQIERYKNITFINAAVLNENYTMSLPTGISIQID